MQSSTVPVFNRPIFLLSAPYSGGASLFSLLSQNQRLWVPSGLRHKIVEHIPELHPKHKDYRSNELTALDATADVVEQLKRNYLPSLRNSRRGAMSALAPSERPKRFRLLDRTGKNALRVDFLNAAFPDALFVYVYRRPEMSVSLLMEGWRGGQYATYKDLPNWFGEYPWSFLLIEGWARLSGLSLAQIAWQQCVVANEAIRSSLRSLASDRVLCLSYESLQTQTEATLQSVCAFCSLPFGEQMNAALAQPSIHFDGDDFQKLSRDKQLMNAIHLQSLQPEMQRSYGRWGTKISLEVK